MLHICHVPGPDCITVSIHWHLSIFALNMKFHRHFRLLGLQIWAKTLLACSKDTQQTSSQVRYGGPIFFLLFFWLYDSLWVSITFCWFNLAGGLRRCGDRSSWWWCSSSKGWCQENILAVFFSVVWMICAWLTLVEGQISPPEAKIPFHAWFKALISAWGVSLLKWRVIFFFSVGPSRLWLGCHS